MDPFGTTRSRLRPDHALIAPESFVAAPLPGWRRAKGVTLVAPRIGARFVQYLALMDAGSAGAPPPLGVERMLYVLDGQVDVDTGHGPRQALDPGGFAYLPPGSGGGLRSTSTARLCVFEKRYVPIPGVAEPAPRIGHERDVAGTPFLGDPDAVLQVLLPDDPSFDMAVNVFTYRPGATLPMVEVHVMEHGLLMLEGQGVYRLSDAWYPVREGDAIWMAPYCPQWFCALGKVPARYLIYKDWNRHPLL
jgi:(S)-ureidoglycine aminohydrolase